MKIKYLSFLFLATSCASTLEEISNIGQPPRLTKANIADHYQEPQDADNNPPTYAKKANSLWEPGSRNFFRDNRARRKGDILKVIVKIKDKASLNNQTTTSRSSKEDLGLKSLLGLEVPLGKAMDKVPGAPLVGTSGGNQRSGNGNIDRKEDIETEVAAIIKEILPNGNLFIVGSQEIRVNYEVRELTVSGVIRSEDISADNSVSSDQIAEARISYGGKGALSTAQRPRYGSQVLDIILPW
jgi:flagellar L-ring protein precursor FlgH